MSDYQLLIGDALEQLRTLPSDSVHCCVTSPPYFGLRDYGTATWEGGDPARGAAGCDHAKPAIPHTGLADATANARGRAIANEGVRSGPRAAYEAVQYRSVCGKCGARRVDQQIGLEATPDEFVARLVEVFREVRRVLHPSGTFWCNIGDSYSSGSMTPHGGERANRDQGGMSGQVRKPPDGLGPKQLLGIPWRLAFALQADGWILRQELIWHKTAPMPESVTDRCTKAHEQVFLLAKSERYFFDHIAIAEPSKGDSGWEKQRRNGQGFPIGGNHPNESLLRNDIGRTGDPSTTRNKRSVWTLSPEIYSGAHYAVMPSKLVEPCVLAGSSAHGVCAACGSPWERVVAREAVLESGRKQPGYGTKTDGGGFQRNGHDGSTLHHDVTKTTLGWRPSCTCGEILGRPSVAYAFDSSGETGAWAAEPIPATVLDPFAGSGTVLAVALKHGRRAIGIDLDPRNEKLVRQRIEQSQPLLLNIHVL